MLFARADWLLWKRLERAIHLRAAESSKSCVKIEISGILTKINYLLVSVWYILRKLFTSVSVKVVDTYFYLGE